MKTKHKHWFALTASTLGLTGLSLASGFGDEKYTYDASGNVLEKQIGDQVTRYDYTGNQLNGSASDSGRKQYAYDSSGRLTSDSEAGKPSRKMEHQYLDKVTKVQNGDKTTEFFYNAEGQLVATNSAGTAEAYAWDGLAMVNRGDQLYVNEAHAVGGVPAIVGNEVAVADIIGSSLSVGNGSMESTAFGEGLKTGLLTGKPFIAVLDGFLFNYRTYSAKDVRWTSADPSGYPDARNNFIYASGDPLTKVDPYGLTEVDYFKVDVDPGINPGTWAGAGCGVYVNVESDYNIEATYHSAIVDPASCLHPQNTLFTYDIDSGTAYLEAPFDLEDKTEEGVRFTRSKTGIKAYAVVKQGSSSKTLSGSILSPGYVYTTWVPEN